MRQLPIIPGLILLVAGLAWPWLGKLPLGRLPGDVNVVRDGVSFHSPVVSCSVVSMSCRC